MESSSVGSNDIDMNILAQSLKLYEKLGTDLFKDISVYMAHGYVHKTPYSLLLAKPVRTDQGNPDAQWNVNDPDAWYVRTAVGEICMSEVISRIPYILPYVGWMRHTKKQPVRFYTFDQVTRRMK